MTENEPLIDPRLPCIAFYAVNCATTHAVSKGCPRLLAGMLNQTPCLGGALLKLRLKRRQYKSVLVFPFNDGTK